MDFKENKQEMVTRLACCVVVALILYYALEKYGCKLHLPLLDQYMPWLRENKVQAIAIVAAILFGASLALLPLEEKKLPPKAEECGYEMVE